MRPLGNLGGGRASRVLGEINQAQFGCVSLRTGFHRSQASRLGAGTLSAVRANSSLLLADVNGLDGYETYPNPPKYPLDR